MSYITWEQYCSLCNSITDEKEFNRMSRLAEIKLNTITHMRAKQFEDAYSEDTATDFQKQVHMQIQDTFCQLLSAMSVQEASGIYHQINWMAQ